MKRKPYKGCGGIDLKGGRLVLANVTPSKTRKAIKGMAGIKKIRSDGNGGTLIIHSAQGNRMIMLVSRIERCLNVVFPSYSLIGHALK